MLTAKEFRRSIKEEEGQVMRKPVGVGQDERGVPIVVCSDGSVWTYRQRIWYRESPIPGTPDAITPEQENEQHRTNMESPKAIYETDKNCDK